MCNQPKSADELALESRKQKVDTLRDYAWSWFAYHAAQRTSMFNYSLVAAALFSAAFGTAAAKSPKVASVVAFVGAIVTFSFWLVDGRNRNLVDRGESVLIALEKEMFANTAPAPVLVDLPNGILTADRVDSPDDAGLYDNYWGGKHKVHLRLIQGLLILVFSCGAVAAFKYPEIIDFADHDTKGALSDLNSQIAVLKVTVDEANRQSENLQNTLREIQTAIDQAKATRNETSTLQSAPTATRSGLKSKHQ